MKNIITQKDWEAIELALMRAQIPFYVSFDAHVTDSLESVVYDKRITVEPFTIQKEEKVNED